MLEVVCAARKPSAPHSLDVPRPWKNTQCMSALCATLCGCAAPPTLCTATPSNSKFRHLNMKFTFPQLDSAFQRSLGVLMMFQTMKKHLYSDGFDFCFSKTHFLMFSFGTFKHFNTALFFKFLFYFGFK